MNYKKLLRNKLFIQNNILVELMAGKSWLIDLEIILNLYNNIRFIGYDIFQSNIGLLLSRGIKENHTNRLFKSIRYILSDDNIILSGSCSVPVRIWSNINLKFIYNDGEVIEELDRNMIEFINHCLSDFQDGVRVLSN